MEHTRAVFGTMHSYLHSATTFTSLPGGVPYVCMQMFASNNGPDQDGYDASAEAAQGRHATQWQPLKSKDTDRDSAKQPAEALRNRANRGAALAGTE